MQRPQEPSQRDELSSPRDQHAEATPAVLGSLYLLHENDLRRFVQGVVRDANLAADVMQSTFEKVLKSGHTADAATFKGWLFRVAFREALVQRRRSMTDEEASRKWAFGKRAFCDSPDATLIRRETAEQVRRAVSDLTEDEQTVVRMRIYEEKKFAVIAGELALPLGTVLTRMRRALKKLRGTLGDEETKHA